MNNKGKHVYLSRKLVSKIEAIQKVEEGNITDSIEQIINNHKPYAEISSNIEYLNNAVTDIRRTLGLFVLAFEHTQKELLETSGQIKHMGKKVEGIQQAGEEHKNMFKHVFERINDHFELRRELYK